MSFILTASIDPDENPQPVEQSLVLLKPDSHFRRQAGVEIISAFKAMPNNRMLCFKELVVPSELAELHYREHAGKSFFPSLVEMLSSKIGVVVMIFEGPSIVKRIRDTLGPTYVEKAKAIQGSLRGQYGMVAGVNSTHASDAPESGTREIMLWTAALDLTLDEAVATAASDKYLERWTGKYPTDFTEVQSTCVQIKEDIVKLKQLLNNESDPASAKKTDDLISLIEASLM